MNNVVIKSPWIVGNVSLKPGKKVQISVVAYEHPAGLPARFCAGLIAAVDLYKCLTQNRFTAVIRIIDPTPIAAYCNGWQAKQTQFRHVIAEFLRINNVEFFFDEAEQINNGAFEVLTEIGTELERCDSQKVKDAIAAIRESGRKYGGRSGASNAILYMAAHPFSWVDMYHPLVWRKAYPPESIHLVNVMSASEERFRIIRDFLKERRPDLCVKNPPLNRYMTLCRIPCYIPIEEEPMHADLTSKGLSWCLSRYSKLRAESQRHNWAHKDFEALVIFPKLGS